mmetsp:Transcript_8635/g.12741  ORF Transcript_8635/g.12741 Transcript_8635/m.12741 type:complete len:434 (+) Transcript_8635:121-1422(+)|eukprot:CAMPEP_0196823800 /NCGR_PEP_ID=MMETSP1362-20130617/89047_1 /TAXON_ID=163516 /ORGANISM="Leptocylindrus danicus, Strain CCMP1856" /LENGTH=433 /DNA_ID=CAMNT_0042203805 /DNA_START=117 /DNA_END=1418 /DNA_ORIENTATION=+
MEKFVRNVDSIVVLIPLVPVLYHLILVFQTMTHLKADLAFYVCTAIAGYMSTSTLIPNIKQYLLKQGICGKDLGKRGTSVADKDIPEALGIVPGTIFLICLILCLVKFANEHHDKLLDCNSALLSICFMLFLGFTDDVLDWPWRYKLMLPSVATLPLLCCYEGSTSILVPKPLRSFIMEGDDITMFGHILGQVVTVDDNAHGAIIDLGLFYLVYMGMLGLFCTNAINIYAGINGLEVGQSYIIACSLLVHNLIEIQTNSLSTENHLFSAMIMFSFLGVTMALLRYNWYPASVFVGDTYCYFAGMTFAVSGILGHFSKTLLLFFIPQIINFLLSVPQLFKLVPCPRHRLPRFDASCGLMHPSTFQCRKDHFRWLPKANANKTEVANMTLINLFLQIFGPMGERNLCLCLLTFQAMCCGLGLYFRYNLAPLFFDE